ncbi:hypothetical protein RRG08_063880 [Elysia crispata]|uniref:Uncharacterized protein n=1 Tax=Elysia crispata TaxID=231223 RepID=A0AAE0YUA5_9GAST|nr:hypothetical protein RRG08_063880 [Elysia crispata]
MSQLVPAGVNLGHLALDHVLACPSWSQSTPCSRPYFMAPSFRVNLHSCSRRHHVPSLEPSWRSILHLALDHVPSLFKLGVNLHLALDPVLECYSWSQSKPCS